LRHHDHVNSQQVLVRSATAADLEPVWLLAREFATSFEVERSSFQRTFSTVLGAHGTLCSIAEVNGCVVGYLFATLHPTFFANAPVTWVEELMVHPQYRRRGIGAALMADAERWSRDGKAAYIALATRRADDFYAGLEYEESATFYRKLLQPASATP
jgi:GNAT superfamily N-acetyltransferase